MFKCLKCTYTTNRSFNLKRHCEKHERQENTHSQIIPDDTEPFAFNCRYCDYKAERLYNLRRHLSLNHSREHDYTVSKFCSKCNHDCGTSRLRWQHEQKCGVPKKKKMITRELYDPPTYIQNNNLNINININLPPTPMPFNIHENSEDIPEFRTDHISYFPNDGLKGVLKEIIRDPYNMPLRKMDIHSPYLEVHVGDNKWSLERDQDITPLFLYHSFNAVRDLDPMNKCRIIQEQCDKVLEALEIKIDPQEYWSENDHRLYKKHKSELINLMRTLKDMAIKNGQRYKPPRLISSASQPTLVLEDGT